LPLQNPPWAQSSAYLSALRDTRNPAHLALTGRADPTGRGRGFAFTREDPKKAKDDAAPPPGVKAQADGTITGKGQLGLGQDGTGQTGLVQGVLCRKARTQTYMCLLSLLRH
jgi:hypothetical protein